MMELE
jgi:hypothetical protein